MSTVCLHLLGCRALDRNSTARHSCERQHRLGVGGRMHAEPNPSTLSTMLLTRYVLICDMHCCICAFAAACIAVPACVTRSSASAREAICNAILASSACNAAVASVATSAAVGGQKRGCSAESTLSSNPSPAAREPRASVLPRKASNRCRHARMGSVCDRLRHAFSANASAMRASAASRGDCAQNATARSQCAHRAASAVDSATCCQVGCPCCAVCHPVPKQKTSTLTLSCCACTCCTARDDCARDVPR